MNLRAVTHKINQMHVMHTTRRTDISDKAVMQHMFNDLSNSGTLLKGSHRTGFSFITGESSTTVLRKRIRGRGRVPVLDQNRQI